MKTYSHLFLLIALFFVGCSSSESTESETSTEPAANREQTETPGKDIGVGPIQSISLSETIDQEMVSKGLVIFEAKCTACHKIEKRFVGPALAGITERREPEWIMNMILNPDVMVKENETAKNLLMEYSAPMANQNLTEEEARNVLEYFRSLPNEITEPINQ